MMGQNSVWKILKIFFAWNPLKHKVKPKNSRNSTFFKKLKFPPYFWKTLIKISIPKLFPWKLADFRLMAEADKKPSESWRLKSRLSVSASCNVASVTYKKSFDSNVLLNWWPASFKTLICFDQNQVLYLLQVFISWLTKYDCQTTVAKGQVPICVCHLLWAVVLGGFHASLYPDPECLLINMS